MNPATSRFRFLSHAPAWLVAALVACTAAAGPYKLTMFHAKDGTAVEYALVLPEGAATGQPLPAVLAFPAGEQEEYEALQGLQQYWGKVASDRGWLVVTMLAPAGMKLHLDGAAYVPELLDEVEASHAIEGGKWHAIGYSDGGFGAFRAVIENSDRFHSLVVFPGGPSRAEEVAQLGRLAKVPVRFFCGSTDTTVVQVSQATADRIRKLGGDAQVTVFEGENHVPASFTSDRLLDELATLRESANARAAFSPGATPQSLLAEFQAAALAADSERFFATFAPDAEVLWMDFPARMGMTGLRKIVEPHLKAGEPLVLSTLDSHVDMIEGGRAWFDQAQITPKGEPCRSSGVLTQGTAGWKIWRLSISCRALSSGGRAAAAPAEGSASSEAATSEESKPKEQRERDRKPPR